MSGLNLRASSTVLTLGHDDGSVRLDQRQGQVALQMVVGKGDKGDPGPPGTGSGGGGGLSAVDTTKTAPATLTVGHHTPVNATSGAVTMTLPASAAVGALVSVEKTDTTTNPVNVTGTLRGVAASTIALSAQYDARTFLSEGSGSWRPISDHRTKSSIDTQIDTAARVVAQAISPSTVANNTAAEVPLCSFALPADLQPGDVYELNAPGNLGHTLAVNANMVLRMRVGNVASMETPVLSLPPSSQPYRFVLRGTVYVGENGDAIMELTLNVGEALATRLNASVINLAGLATAGSVGAGTIVSITAQVFTFFGYATLLRSSLRRRARPSVVTHLFAGAQVTRGGIPAQISSPSREWNAKSIAPQVDRIEVRSGDFQQSDGAIKERVEFYRDPINFDTDYWLSYALFIEPGTTSTADFCVLGQAQRTFDAADAATSPPLEFTLEGTDLLCKTRSDPAATTTFQPTAITRYTIPSLARGQWHYFVHRARFSRTGTGHLASWVDGVSVFDADIPLGMNDTTGPYWKWGIYRHAVPETIAARWANVEGFTTTSLLSRVTTPLPIAS